MNGAEKGLAAPGRADEADIQEAGRATEYDADVSAATVLSSVRDDLIWNVRLGKARDSIFLLEPAVRLVDAGRLRADDLHAEIQRAIRDEIGFTGCNVFTGAVLVNRAMAEFSTVPHVGPHVHALPPGYVPAVPVVDDPVTEPDVAAPAYDVLKAAMLRVKRACRARDYWAAAEALAPFHDLCQAQHLDFRYVANEVAIAVHASGHSAALGVPLARWLTDQIGCPDRDDPPPEPMPRDLSGRSIKVHEHVWRDPAAIPPREWLYGRHYIRSYITTTLAPGGLGKSSNALVEALDMVTGRGLLTHKPTQERYRVWYHCGEDPLEEIDRRVAGICRWYRISEADIGGRLYLTSGRDSPVCIATEDRGGVTIVKATVDDFASEIAELGLDVVILDPFVSTHRVSENSNSAIDFVAKQFARIADETGCAIELIHHTRKASSGASGQDQTADDGRGAGALVNAARSTRVLNRMQPSEAQELGIEDDERRRYFRTDADKVNMSPPGGRGVWRYLASQPLGNASGGRPGDEVGVVVAWERPEPDLGFTAEHVAEIRTRLQQGAAENRRSDKSPEWVGVLIARVAGVDLATKAGRKRVGVITDLMVRDDALRTVTRKVNGRDSTFVDASHQWCHQSIQHWWTGGKAPAQHPTTAVVGGVGVCGVVTAADQQSEITGVALDAVQQAAMDALAGNVTETCNRSGDNL